MHAAYFGFWLGLSGVVLAALFISQFLQKRQADQSQQQILALVEALHLRNERLQEQLAEDRKLHASTLAQILTVAQPSTLPAECLSYLMEMNRFSMSALHTMAHSAQEKVAAFADHRVQGQVAAQFLRTGPGSSTGSREWRPAPGAASGPQGSMPDIPGDGFRTQPVAETPVDAVSIDPGAFSGRPTRSGSARDLSERLTSPSDAGLESLFTAEDLALMREEQYRQGAGASSHGAQELG
jgi:hypothetical protein